MQTHDVLVKHLFHIITPAYDGSVNITTRHSKSNSDIKRHSRVMVHRSAALGARTGHLIALCNHPRMGVCWAWVSARIHKSRRPCAEMRLHLRTCVDVNTQTHDSGARARMWRWGD